MTSTQIMEVPLLDLKGQYRALKPQLDEAVARVIESQYFILGPEVTALEHEIATYSNVKHGVVRHGHAAIAEAAQVLAREE